MPPISWEAIGLIWAYDLAWMVLMDVFKLGAYRLVEHRAGHHLLFLGFQKQRLHHAHLQR